MEKEDLKFLTEIIEKSNWLFYGEFEIYLNKFLKKIFVCKLSDLGFDTKGTNEFQTAYWSILSELVRLDLAEYGTSPRGAWLTENGERFKKIILENENALKESEEEVYKKYN